MISVSAAYSPDQEYFGGGPEMRPLEFDHHCPDMGEGLRTTKANCLRRQSRGGGCHNTTCKAGIELSGIPHIPKQRKTVAPPLCACGKVSTYLGVLKRAGITEPTCKDCWNEIKRKRRKKYNSMMFQKKQAEKKAKQRAKLEAQLAQLG